MKDKNRISAPPLAASASDVEAIEPVTRVAATDFRREVVYANGRFFFLLHGELGSISFSLSTGWEVSEGQFGVGARTRHGDMFPNAFGVDYHARFKTECGYHRESCEWLGDTECWSDGSGLAGDTLLRKMIAEGSDAIWPELEDFYRSWLVNEAPPSVLSAMRANLVESTTPDPISEAVINNNPSISGDGDGDG